MLPVNRCSSFRANGAVAAVALVSFVTETT